MVDSIYALGHEMINIKQRRDGRLVVNRGGIVWEGKFFSTAACESKVLYQVLPWEVEAFGQDTDLFKTVIARLSDVDKMVALQDENERQAA
jgi:hypothetical protein